MRKRPQSRARKIKKGWPLPRNPCHGGRMRIYGIDFTSRPTRRKLITCLAATLDGTLLPADDLTEWAGFDGFKALLRRPGPWIAGIDFPFGQSRKLVENMGWPSTWQGYVAHVKTLGRQGFRNTLDTYRANRPPGDKEHRRKTDLAAGSISPQKLYGTPVGLMFFEGAPRLLDANVTIPHVHQGNPQRIVVEAYPGVLARNVIGRRSYKQDTKAKQTKDQFEARKEMLEQLTGDKAKQLYRLSVSASATLADDPTGDHLDALLCAIQAAWAWTQKNNGHGAPNPVYPLEGWIADPAGRD